MINSFRDGELAMAGVQELPDDINDNLGFSQHNIPVTSGVMVFMNTTAASVKVLAAGASCDDLLARDLTGKLPQPQP